MDHETKLLEFLSLYKEYRKKQAKLVKLRDGQQKKGKSNVKPVMSILATIGDLTKKMDAFAIDTLRLMQAEGECLDAKAEMEVVS